MPHISYAGVPLLLEDPGHELQRWLDDNLALVDREFFSQHDAWYREGRERSRGSRLSRLNGYATPNVTLPVPNYSSYRPPRWKLNSLWWPTGASRHSIGLFLASSTELEQIYAAFEYSGFQYADLVITENPANEEDGRALTCEKMYLLPPLRLSNVSQAESSLWLLCIVDQRYFWHFATTGNFSISSGDTWEDLIDLLGTRLSTTITYDDVPDAYGSPDPVEVGRLYEDPAMMLDAIAASVGQRVVFGYDSSVGLLNYTSSQEIFDENKLLYPPIAAGGLSESSWRVAAYPESVRVVFPVRNFYQLTLEQGRNLNVAYTDLFDDERTTGSGSFKTFYTTALADFSGTTSGASADYLTDDPENLADMQGLAEIIAEDFYGYLSAPYDVSFPGIFKWVPEGFNDWIWYHAGCQRCAERDGHGDYEYATRVVSQAIDFGVTSQLSQLLDPVEVLELTACDEESPAIYAYDTRDYATGELLSENIGQIARIFHKCFEVVGLSTELANAIRVPVASFQADCTGCADGEQGPEGPAGPPGADGSVGYTAGCGIVISGGNVLEVDAADLAGPGLVVTTGCELAVNPGCGIAVNIDDEVVIDESIFGAGLVFSSSECTVEVVLEAGCGINVSGHNVSVKNTDLVGLNGGLKTAGSCGLAVDPDCGIEVGAGGVKVKASDLVGVNGGLETSGDCGLAVKEGCGILVDADGVNVKPSELVGRGLIESPEPDDCLIDINHNCSLEIPAAGGYANKLKVHEDFPDDENGGIEWVDPDPDTGQCSIKVKHDCTLDIVDGELGIERDITGQYLVWTDSSCGAQAKLNVQRSLTSWITDITFFGIEGDTLVIKYARNFGYVLEQTGTVFAEKRVLITDPCAEV